jgi:hypothetical protein
MWISVKVRLNEKEIRSVKMEQALDQDAACHPFYLTARASTSKEVLEGFGYFKIGG